MFARHGVRIEVVETPGSVFQLVELVEGRADLAITLVDNVLAYREGQGEAPVIGPDLVALMAADTRVFPALVALPGIGSWEDLRGRVLSVDAKTTGYAYLLVAMLEARGLAPGDYELVSAGGVRQRYEAMLEGRHAAALFNSPFEELLSARGYRVLGTAREVLDDYQGQVLAARSAVAHARRGEVAGFISAFLEAVNWLYDPAHLPVAKKVFAKNQPHENESAAESAYTILFDPKAGFPRDGRLRRAGLERVIAIRARYGKPPREFGDPGLYTDESFLEEALGTGIPDRGLRGAPEAGP